MAFHAIKAGEGHAFVSAGVECVSRYPAFSGAGAGDEEFVNPLFDQARARTEATAKTNETWHDPREDGLLPDVYISMGQTAENLATSRGITRADQDEFGVRSQNLAEKAIADGFFEREITPITTPDGTRGRTRRRPAAGRDAWRAWPGSRRSSARRARSPPATAARSTTERQPS